MEGAVALVAVVQYVAELRIWLVALGILADDLQLRRVAGNVQRNGVDVPAVQQADTGGALIAKLQQVGGSELPLNPEVPVHDVGGAYVGIVEGRRTPAEVRANEGRRPIRLNVEVDVGRALR